MKAKAIRAWAVVCKESVEGKEYNFQYDAHFHRSIALEELKKFRDSNSYRIGVFFKIVPVLVSPLPPKKKGK